MGRGIIPLHYLISGKYLKIRMDNFSLKIPKMRKARFYSKTNGFVRCTACRHSCILRNGQVGVCGVRANIDNSLYSLVYGKPLAIHIDPIEKKPLFHFLPSSRALSIGTFGCNFSCLFCQNHEMSQGVKNKPLKEVIGIIDRYSENLDPEEIVDMALMNNVEVIAYTYNEPTVFAEYFLDTARIAKRKGIKNVLVSNGYFSYNLLRRIVKVIDAVNIDLKSINPDFYRRIVGANLEYVLRNISLLKKYLWVELTTLIIPGENDGEQELRAIAKWIYSLDPNIPWHISRFFPFYKMMDKNSTPIDTLFNAYNIAKSEGLRHVYIGNYPSDKENTYCPKCGALLIERSMYNVRIVDLDLEKGICKKCGEKISGVWNNLFFDNIS